MSKPDAAPQSQAGAALTELILLVFRLNGRLLEAAEQMAAAGGLTAARWQVLGGVLDEPRPVAEIARRMGLTRQSAQWLATPSLPIRPRHENRNPRPGLPGP